MWPFSPYFVQRKSICFEHVHIYQSLQPGVSDLLIYGMWPVPIKNKVFRLYWTCTRVRLCCPNCPLITLCPEFVATTFSKEISLLLIFNLSSSFEACQAVQQVRCVEYEMSSHFLSNKYMPCMHQISAHASRPTAKQIRWSPHIKHWG